MKWIPALFLTSLLFLSGCASLKKEPENTQKLNCLSIEKGVFLETDGLFPLPFQGVLLQNITARFQEHSPSFSVHLTLSPQIIKAVAFNDIAGQLYDLEWSPHDLAWSASKYLPKQLKPENILSDFLLVALPLEILKKHLHGATASEENGLRLIRINNKNIREIKRTEPSGLFWKHIVLKNTKQNYELTIQTVELP